MNDDVDNNEILDEEDEPRGLSGHLEDELQKELDAEGVVSEEATTEDSSAESEAKKFGHLSKEEWEAQGRDPSKYKSEEEFVKYGNEYKEVKDLIKSLKEENKTYSKQIDILVDAHKRTAETAVQQARRELEAQLSAAKEYGDVASVEKLTQQKVTLDLQAAATQEKLLLDERTRIDQTFLDRNKHWFNQANPEMISKSQEVSNEIKQYYPNLSYAEHVRRIEERMKFEHPEIVIKEGNAAPHIRSSNSGVAKSTANSSTAGNSEERLLKGLSATERAEYNTVRKLVEKIPGIKYTVSEYVTQNKKGRN